MRLVVQRVRSARVTAGAEEVGRIGAGALVLVGVARDDTDADADHLAGKTARLRIFDDAGGRMNEALAPGAGAFLAVSQFTLYGDCAGGNRPGFTEAAEPAAARALFDRYVAGLRGQGHRVETGRFGAKMVVELENDGPVTLLLESRGRSRP